MSNSVRFSLKRLETFNRVSSIISLISQDLDYILNILLYYVCGPNLSTGYDYSLFSLSSFMVALILFLMVIGNFSAVLLIF